MQLFLNGILFMKFVILFNLRKFLIPFTLYVQMVKLFLLGQLMTLSVGPGLVSTSFDNKIMRENKYLLMV